MSDADQQRFEDLVGRLEQIVGREANLDMTQYRGIFMRERLRYLFRWQRLHCGSQI